VFGESLSQTQLLGGALVLAAVLVVQWPARGVAVSRHVARVPGSAL
jgi:drug/metabolite transporter (DMT)-like permease